MEENPVHLGSVDAICKHPASSKSKLNILAEDLNFDPSPISGLDNSLNHHRPHIPHL